MNFNRLRLASIIAAGFAALVCSQPANAQSDRTFLSVHGVDSPTCGAIDSPCQTFNVAITNTNPKGEVIALDSGVYVSPDIGISKSITLTAAPGAHVELYHTAVLVILSGDTNVTLRNLSVSGGSGLQNRAIQVAGSSGTVSIDHCVVSGATGDGIDFETTGTVQSFIRDTTVTDTGEGLVVAPSAGLLKASVEHCRFENNSGEGLRVNSFCRITARESVSSGNELGFVLAGGSDLTLDRCEASNNRTGVLVQDNIVASSRTGEATISNSVVTNNSDRGLWQISGVTQSAGNNIVRHNGTNTSGTITVISGT